MQMLSPIKYQFDTIKSKFNDVKLLHNFEPLRTSLWTRTRTVPSAPTSLQPGGYTMVTRSLEAPPPLDVDALVDISASLTPSFQISLPCHFSRTPRT